MKSNLFRKTITIVCALCMVASAFAVSFAAGEGKKEPPAQSSSEQTADRPADRPDNVPANKPADAPSGMPANKPADAPSGMPADMPKDGFNASDMPKDGLKGSEKEVSDAIGKIEDETSKTELDSLMKDYKSAVDTERESADTAEKSEAALKVKDIVDTINAALKKLGIMLGIVQPDDKPVVPTQTQNNNQ